jgi:hypothetical protein
VYTKKVNPVPPPAPQSDSKSITLGPVKKTQLEVDMSELSPIDEGSEGGLSEVDADKGTDDAFAGVCTFLPCRLKYQLSHHRIKENDLPSARSREMSLEFDSGASDQGFFNALVAGLPNEYVSPISLKHNLATRA